MSGITASARALCELFLVSIQKTISPKKALAPRSVVFFRKDRRHIFFIGSSILDYLKNDPKWVNVAVDHLQQCYRLLYQ